MIGTKTNEERLAKVSIGIREMQRGLDELTERGEMLPTIWEALVPSAITSGHAPDFAIVQECNEAWAEMLGVPKGEIIHKLTYRDFTHPEDIDDSDEKAAALAEGRAESFITDKRYANLATGEYTPRRIHAKKIYLGGKYCFLVQAFPISEACYQCSSVQKFVGIL